MARKFQMRRGQVHGAGHADAVMIEPANPFEGVAERKVPDVVQQSRDAGGDIGRVDVRHQGEHPERVLQPAVSLDRCDRRRPGVSDERQTAYPPTTQQVLLDICQPDR